MNTENEGKKFQKRWTKERGQGREKEKGKEEEREREGGRERWGTNHQLRVVRNSILNSSDEGVSAIVRQLLPVVKLKYDTCQASLA